MGASRVASANGIGRLASSRRLRARLAGSSAWRMSLRECMFLSKRNSPSVTLPTWACPFLARTLQSCIGGPPEAFVGVLQMALRAKPVRLFDVGAERRREGHCGAGGRRIGDKPSRDRLTQLGNALPRLRRHRAGPGRLLQVPRRLQIHLVDDKVDVAAIDVR